MHSRTSSRTYPEGYYIVRLSFKNGPPISLGESRSAASPYRMEQRLVRDSINASEYGDFLAEYENFNHMIKSHSIEIVKPDQHYYIPHHAVLRDSSTTTPYESSSMRRTA